MYILKKWYFDFLTPANEYAFVYFATVRFAGRTWRSLTVHLARPGQEPAVTRSLTPDVHEERTGDRHCDRIRVPDGELKISKDACSLDFSGAGCSVDLRFSSGSGVPLRPLRVPAPGGAHILWTPIGLQYRVSGVLTIDGITLAPSEANGYVDYMECTALPPLVPVRSLSWGRLHHPGLEMVYVRAENRAGRQSWSKLFLREGSLVAENDECAIATTQDGYILRSSGDTGTLRVEVRRSSIVQQSSFIDQQEITSSPVRSLLKLLTRHPRSTKFLSYATVFMPDGARTPRAADIPMIDENALL